MEDKEYREIMTYEIRELRNDFKSFKEHNAKEFKAVRKEITGLKFTVVKVSGMVSGVFGFIAAYIKGKFFT